MKNKGLEIIFICAAIFIIACKQKEMVKKTAMQDTLQPQKIDSAKEEDDIIFNTTANNISRDSISISLAKGDSFKLAVLKGYNISVAAEGLQRPRFLTMSPAGKLFCTDMYDRSDNTKGAIYIFENWNDSAKKFEKQQTYLSGLHNPNQLAFYKDFIYVAETDKLVRYHYADGDLSPKDSGEVIATFPAYGLSYKYGGWHLTRSIAFHNDKLYVSVGSSCNACIEKEEIRASIVEMNPDGSDMKFFARGLRNSVGIKWLGNELWATPMGRDLIGPDKPEELFLKIERNGFYGWPFYYQYRNNVYEDDQFKDSAKAAWVKKPAPSFAAFKAHSAPLGFAYMSGFDDPYLNNAVLVCLHGSTTVSRMRGNAIVRVEGGNNYTDIVSGFLQGKTEKERYGRPCDIFMKDKRSFFFTDDTNGVLYYVWK